METHSNQSGRLTPQDIDAEKSLLGAVLLSDESFPDILEKLSAKDFYDQSHQKIYQAMANLYANHRPIDLTTITSELRAEKNLKSVGGAAYLAELTNFVPTSAHSLAYANAISECATRRHLIEAGTDIVVAGSSVFKSEDPAATIAALRA